MKALPEVRFSSEQDEDDVFKLCREMWHEGGIFPMSESRVRRMIRNAIHPKDRTPVDPMAIIGVIGEPGKIEASIGLCLTQFWYTDEWHIEDIWNFVRPNYRRSHNARALMEFGRMVQEKIALKLIMGVFSGSDPHPELAPKRIKLDVLQSVFPGRTATKVELYRQAFGKPCGAVFVWPPSQPHATAVS